MEYIICFFKLSHFFQAVKTLQKVTLSTNFFKLPPMLQTKSLNIVFVCALEV